MKIEVGMLLVLKSNGVKWKVVKENRGDFFRLENLVYGTFNCFSTKDINRLFTKEV